MFDNNTVTYATYTTNNYTITSSGWGSSGWRSSEWTTITGTGRLTVMDFDELLEDMSIEKKVADGWDTP